MQKHDEIKNIFFFFKYIMLYYIFIYLYILLYLIFQQISIFNKVYIKLLISFNII